MWITCLTRLFHKPTSNHQLTVRHWGKIKIHLQILKWILIAVWLQNSLPSLNQKRLRSSPFPRGKKQFKQPPKKTWLTVVFCLFLSASQKGSAIKRPDIHADVVPTNIKRNQHLSMQATSWGKRWLSFDIYIEYWHMLTRGHKDRRRDLKFGAETSN